MTDRESSAKQVFLDALEQPEAARAAFVADACANDEALRRRVDELLAVHADSEAVGTTRLADLVPGSRIDKYLLIERLGEGGFGVVYLAEQEQPVRRQVALKVLKLGMDTVRVIARFEQERQTLALMDHPNIAKVLDAGATPTGRPYFVMERVPGVPITCYCAERALRLAERLDLFRAVCLAVQHAHQKGILHRDFKPSNVLVAEVDGQPVPRVIDFGIAKAIGGGLPGTPALTAENQPIGTPSYMSPEQMRGAADVDTRSDVYALGVTLYELVTGTVPFEPGLGFDAFRRTVMGTDPPPPSARVEAGADPSQPFAVPRELDWIILRCLAREREQRYPSALALEQDLARLLNHLPVEAAPPSAAYRLRKLLRRHRGAAIAAAAVLLALTAGAVAAAIGFVEARHQANVAREVNQFFTRDLLPAARPSDRPGRGRNVTLREVLDSAAARIDEGGRFHDEPLVEAAIRRSIGETYLVLGLLKEAEIHLRRAEELGGETSGLDNPDQRQLMLARATALRNLGRFTEGEALLHEVLGFVEDRLGEDHQDAVAARIGLALSLAMRGRTEEAVAHCRKVLTLVPDDLVLRHQRARENVAVALARCHLGEEANELFRRALEVERTLLAPGDPDLLDLTVNFAVTERRAGRVDEAERLLAEVLEHAEHEDGLLGSDHPITIVAAYNLGSLRLEKGMVADADRLLTDALDAARRVFGPGEVNTLGIIGQLARVREQQGRLADAEQLTREALAAATEAFGEAHLLTVSLLNDLAAELVAQEREEEAEELLWRAHAAAEQAFGAGHAHTAITRSNLAEFLRDRGREEEARAVEREAAGPGRGE